MTLFSGRTDKGVKKVRGIFSYAKKQKAFQKKSGRHDGSSDDDRHFAREYDRIC